MSLQNRILAVDDNPTNLVILETLLRDNYDLRTAESGDQALVLVDEFRPDLILLDIMMPGMSGYEVCRRVKDNLASRETKIIMVSAKAMVEERLEGYEAGADDYVSKPFDHDELLAKVGVYLRLKSVEEMDQLKTSFLTLIGHEICTPLSGLISPAEMLASDESVDEGHRKMLAEMVHRNAQRIHQLFEKVTDLCAIKSGLYELEFVPTELGRVVREAVSALEGLATEKNVGVDVRSASMASVMLDEQRISTAIKSVIGNAIRFSPSGGVVAVDVEDRNDTVCLSVTDQGPGIEPDRLPYIFDEFGAVDVDHHTEGQGLSLALAREIVIHHQGTIDVENCSTGGTRFIFRLPMASQQESDARLLSTDMAVSPQTANRCTQ
ncbi:MAG: hybrid sensor histidine kinase/response regulator [Planctomycetes bacterium]|nr:hybrid sensor histidine kinase/response regulator [Planctomycetota bacterium]